MPKEFWFDRYEGAVNKFAFVMILSMAAVFLLTIYKFSFDGPYANDDFQLFVVTFSERFLAAETLSEKIKYLFSRNAYPHPKFFGRLFSAAHYQIYDTVNFKFLILLGSAILTGFLFVVRRTTNLDYVLLVPIALMLLLPERMNFWVGTATGFPVILVLSLIILHLLSKGKIVLPAILAFFTAFAQNPGMAIFIAALPMFLMAPNKSWKKFGVWLFAFALTIYIFWRMILSTHPSGLGKSGGFSLPEFAQCLPSKLAYEGQFLSLPILGDNTLGPILRNMPVLAAALTLLIFASFIWLVWQQRKTFSARKAMFLSFLLFGLSGGALAALFSDTCGTMTDGVASRYMVWSVMAWVGIYLFLLEASTRKFQLLTALVFAGLFLPRFVSEYKTAPAEYANRHYTWVQIGTMTNVPPNRTWFPLDDLKRAIEDGVFKPSFSRGNTSSFPLPAIRKGIKSVWYDYVENEYYCKVEAIIGAKDDPIIEFWIGTSDDLTRIIPDETDPKRVRRFLRTGSRLLNENPTVTRHAKSYLYISDDLEACKRIRIRRGDGVSEFLVPK